MAYPTPNPPLFFKINCLHLCFPYLTVKLLPSNQIAARQAKPKALPKEFTEKGREKMRGYRFLPLQALGLKSALLSLSNCWRRTSSSLFPEKQTNRWTIIPILSPPSFSWKTNRWTFKSYLLLSPEKQTDEHSDLISSFLLKNRWTVIQILSPPSFSWITNRWTIIQIVSPFFSWKTNKQTNNHSNFIAFFLLKNKQMNNHSNFISFFLLD